MAVIDQRHLGVDEVTLQERGEEGEVFGLGEGVLQGRMNPRGWQWQGEPSDAERGRFEGELIVGDEGSYLEAADAASEVVAGDGDFDSGGGDVDLRRSEIDGPLRALAGEPLRQARGEPGIDGLFGDAQSPHIILWADLLELLDQSVFGGLAEF